MINVEISPEVAAAAPGLKDYVIQTEVKNLPTSDELWAELTEAAARVRDTWAMEQINKRPAIAATRAAYKALGKEPNRYRPSSEALCRRCVKGLELYRSNTVVDLINLVSMLSGHSIGGFDADAIAGDTLVLGVGREGEPYEGIGRGQLNIACMPVLRDAIGGIGTPTSDNERTKMHTDTTRLLMTIHMYGPSEMPDAEVLALTTRLLTQYASAGDITVTEVRSQD